MTPAHLKIIKQQIKLDLIGKDAFRGVTLSYSWLANQFGHFALGFIPAAIGYSIYRRYDSGRDINFWTYLPTIIVWFGWFVFELVNFTSTIFKKKKITPIEEKAKKNFYDPRKWHFRRDLFVDLCLFAFGTLAASFIFMLNTFNLVCSFFLILVIFYESGYWYPAKIYLQRALYPFQYRLSQWNREMSDRNREAINSFMEASFDGTHLLILGEDDDEKIHLCTGIGSEISYQLIKCRYLTTMKVFECFYRAEPEDSCTSHEHSWNWQEAELLVIDDINPSHAQIKEVITAEEFYDKINNDHGERNKKMLREKKVIWMLGNEVKDNMVQKEWKDMLVSVGVDRSNIITINLSEARPAVDDLNNTCVE